MRAITRNKYGNPDILQLKEIEKPSLKPKEVLVRVHYTTVNRTDCGILTGKPYLIRAFTGLINPSSKIPGTDFSGVVEEIGKEVSQFKVGDRVWGLNDEGLASQAEYLTIKESEAILTIPNGVSIKDVVACAEGAHYAINFLNKVTIQDGDKVLINGATGAIGSAALQILKAKGAIITAVGDDKNQTLLSDLGANKVYSYEQVDFTEVDKEQYPFIFDAVGKSNFGKCKKLLTSNGVYISSELGPNAENLFLPITTSIKGGKKVIFPIPVNRKRSLIFMNQLLVAGAFKSVIEKEFLPENVKDAYEYVMSGQKTGNVLLDFTAK